MGSLRLHMNLGNTIRATRSAAKARPISIAAAASAFLLLLALSPSLHAAEPAWRRAALLERGANVYERQCAGCHGLNGDGQGEAADLLYPKPRDFVAAEYKFSSRPTPELPTDDDLRQVIRQGLQGTSMNGFPLMAEGDVTALIAYLKTFSDRWEEPQGPPLALPEDPWAGREAEGIERGREVYHIEAVCLSCHPSYLDAQEVESLSERLGYPAIPLRGDAHLPIARETADGSLIFPPDFRRDRIKTGDDIENLYRVIGAGITTTAMPTWDGILEPEQLWGLAHYVRSLAEERPARVAPDAYALRPAVDPSIPPVSVADEPYVEAETFIEPVAATAPQAASVAPGDTAPGIEAGETTETIAVVGTDAPEIRATAAADEPTTPTGGGTP